MICLDVGMHAACMCTCADYFGVSYMLVLVCAAYTGMRHVHFEELITNRMSV